jgi:hypothetical protein
MLRHVTLAMLAPLRGLGVGVRTAGFVANRPEFVVNWPGFAVNLGDSP